MLKHEKTLKKYQDLKKSIKSDTEKIIALGLHDEIREAIRKGDKELYEELCFKAKENTGEIDRLSDRVWFNEIKSRVLLDNFRRQFGDFCLSVFLPELEKYNGKQYGTKTADKLYDVCKAHGFGFSFDPRYFTECNQVSFYCHAVYLNIEVTFYGNKDNKYCGDSIIDSSNKIVCKYDSWSCHVKEYENIDSHVREIIRIYRKCKKVQTEYETYRSLLNHIKPSDLPEMDYCKSFDWRF